MKNRYYLPVLAAIILGLAGLGHAQKAPFNPEEGNGKWSASEPAVSPAYTQYEYFNAEIGNVPAPIFSAPALHQHAGTAGKLKVETPIKLGEINLKPGEYIVRHVDTGKEHFVDFAQVVENDFAPEGTSVYEVKAVAKANCTMEPLNSTVARTELVPKDGMTARLEIRGEKAAHLF